MADDLFHQMAQQAPSASTGGLAGAILAYLASIKMFARPEQIEAAKAELRKELAESNEEAAKTYVTKDDLKPMADDLRYIRDRVDRLVDR